MKDETKSVEELERENIFLKETIAVQHGTINNLIDTYIIKSRPEQQPKHQKR